MNDCKQLINDIKLGLYKILPPDQLEKVEEVLYMKTSKYEINQKSTELTLCNDSPIKLLKLFAVEKSTEGLSPLSIKRYYYLCEKMLLSIGKPIKDITAYDLRVYLANYKQQNQISNRTLNNTRLCFSSFFSWLATENIIQDNPCTALTPIKYETKIQKPFSYPEMEKIKRACTSKRDRALVEILYSTGCRVSELSQLNINEIDFQQGSALIHGKGGKERIVYINDIAMMYLVEYLQDRDDSSPALFIGRGTERLTTSGIQHCLKRLGRKAEVENVHPHRYRRTLASNMLERGSGIQYVQDILGHEDIKTTRIYCYVSQENIKAAHNRYAV